jgi:LysM repeat protein
VWFVNQEQTYHIDTTPEEDKLFRDIPIIKTEVPKKGTFTKILCIVVSLHIAIASVIVLSSNANAAPEKSQSLSSNTNTTEPKEVATSNSTTEKTNEAKVLETPKPKETPKPTTSSTPISPVNDWTNKNTKASPTPPIKLYTKEYIVKHGDSVYSISKKYKLSVDRLIKLNNIKDANKIQVGQTLKFM